MEKADLVLTVTVNLDPGEYKTDLRLHVADKTAWEAKNIVTKMAMKDKPPGFNPADPFKAIARPKVVTWMNDLVVPSKIVFAGGNLYTLPGDSELHIPIPHTPKKPSGAGDTQHP